MKKQFKKAIAIVLTATMMTSVALPAFSADENIKMNSEFLYGDYCDYTLAELNSLAANNISTYSANIVDDLYNSTVEKVKYLAQFDNNNQYVSLLSVLDIDNIHDIILTEGLNEEQAELLIRTWATNENFGVTATPPTEISVPVQSENDIYETAISPAAYSGDIEIRAVATDYTGYHYIVRSDHGYNKASGHITLPTKTNGSNMPSSNPDVPCVHFGIYTQDNTIGFDLGASLHHSDESWRCCISGYAKYGGAASENGGEAYTRYYKELTGANGTSLKFTKEQYPKLYFVANAIKRDGYDTFKLTVVDSATWSTLGEITVNTNEKGYNAQYVNGVLVPNLAPNVSHLDTDYANCRMHREVTIAYNSDPARVLTGTRLEDAKWEKVYIYSPSVTALWGTSHTMNAQYQAQTEARARKVSTQIVTKWNEDITDIICQ